MAPRRTKAGLASTIAGGDLRTSLEALRDHLAGEIERSEGSAVASLSKQLTDVLKALAAIPDEREKSRVDDLAKRRAVRRAKTATPQGTTRGVKRGSGGRRARS